jgi:hypothetical protein
MDVFELRRRLIDDYRAYVTSFISIRDERIRQKVDDELADGWLRPDPRIGLNPQAAAVVRSRLASAQSRAYDFAMDDTRKNPWNISAALVFVNPTWADFVAQIHRLMNLGGARCRKLRLFSAWRFQSSNAFQGRS